MPSIPQLRDQEPQSITRHSDGDVKYTPFTVVKGVKIYVPEPGGEENDNTSPARSTIRAVAPKHGSQEAKNVVAAEDQLQVLSNAPGIGTVNKIRDDVKTVADDEVFIEEIRTRNRIRPVLMRIKRSSGSKDLDIGVQTYHLRGKLTKEITGPEHSDWVAHPITEVPGSREVTKAFNKRRKQHVKSEEVERTRR